MTGLSLSVERLKFEIQQKNVHEVSSDAMHTKQSPTPLA